MSSTAKIPARLSDDFYNEGMSALRFVIWVIVFFCLFSVISSFISRVCFASCASSLMLNDPNRYMGMGMGRDIDTFSNISSDQVTFSKVMESKFQTIPLTAPDTDQKSPSHLMFGQANKYIDEINTRINISANLYVLDGNVFVDGAEKIDQSYQAYLINSVTKNKLNIGEVKKDNDGVYKLQYKAKNKELSNFDSIEITYKIKESEKIILIGKFSDI